MSITLYGIKNCDTIKKSRAWLDAHGIAYDFHDYKTAGISEKTLRAWLKQVPWEQLVNRSGMTWRKLSDEQKAKITHPNDAMELMLVQTSVIKRPVIEVENKIKTIGFNADDYSRLFID